MKKGMVGVSSLLAGTIVGAVGGMVGMGKSAGTRLQEVQQLSDKHLALFRMMSQWVAVKQEGKNLADCLKKMGYREIAVYGMSYAGERLVAELKDTDVKIKYGIDQNANNLRSGLQIYSPEDELEKVDAVVVTPIFFFDEIEEKLRGKTDCPIISLEELLYEV